MKKLPFVSGIKLVKRKLADGTVFIYFYPRPAGRRLSGEPGDAAFTDAYQRAEVAAAGGSPTVETISDLICVYQAALAWTDLKPTTRETEQFHIRAILRTFGSVTLVEAAGARAALLRWHADRAARHPRDADARLSRFSRILKFAVTIGLLDAHPLPTFKRAYKAPTQGIAVPLVGSSAANAQHPPAEAGRLPPRLLSKAQAAAYLGLTPRGFDRWRRDGKIPDALPSTARWDRHRLDEAIDVLSTLGALGRSPLGSAEEAAPKNLTEWRAQLEINRVAQGRPQCRTPKEIRDAWKKR